MDLLLHIASVSSCSSLLCPQVVWSSSSTCCACRYCHPQGLGGFATPEIGLAFRRAAYQHAGITLKDGAPKTMTMLTAVGGEPIANAPQVVAALQDAGQALGMRVRPYSVTAGELQTFVWLFRAASHDMCSL